MHANGRQTSSIDLAAVSLLELANLIMLIDLQSVSDAFVEAGMFAAIQRACLAAADCSLLHVAAGRLVDRMLAASVTSASFGAVDLRHAAGRKRVAGRVPAGLRRA